MKGFTPVILIMVSIGMFYFYTTPGYEKLQELRARQTEYASALEAASQLDEVENRLVESYNMFSKADLAKLETLIPRSVEEDKILFNLDSIAKTYKVDIANISVVKEVAKNRNANEVEDPTALHTFRVSFAVSGTYPNIISFMRDVEKNLRMIDIVNLSFDNSKKDPKTKTSDYTFLVTIQTYWLK